MSDQPKYPNNPLLAFDAGCNMDLRVRLAIQFLSGPVLSHITGSADVVPKVLALTALNLATELLAESEARGLITPVPPPPVNTAVGAPYPVPPAVIAQRIAREESPVVTPMNG